MISGRGLGHTGGTLDKLSSIPGYDLQPESDRFQAVVEEIGCAIIGQTSTLAPADSRLYAIRDVTATVESVSLITASILSKKLAAGLDALVMDIKVGNGAFMSSMSDAQELATNINRVAHEAGLKTQAVITDMNQPLAPVAGNALEIAECVDYLRGDRCDSRLHEVVLKLGSALLRCSGLAHDEAQASERLEASLASGEALTRFDKMIAALGGPKGFSEQVDTYLPRAPIIHEVVSPKTGFVLNVDVHALGMAVVCLGGGRSNPTDRIDPSVGVDQIVRIGTEIREGDPICRLHASKSCLVPAIEETIKQAITIGDLPVASATSVIVETVKGADSL
jgi:thymidine phosphorylase